MLREHRELLFQGTNGIPPSSLIHGLPGFSQIHFSETWDLCASRDLVKFLGPPRKTKSNMYDLSPDVTGRDEWYLQHRLSNRELKVREGVEKDTYLSQLHERVNVL